MSTAFQDSNLHIYLYMTYKIFSKPSDFNGVTWNPIDSEAKSRELKYLEISTNPRIITEPFFDRVQFWNSLNLR